MAGNKLLVPQSNGALDRFKHEIAAELGVELGADTSSRLNGSVGGEMVKRMIRIAEAELSKQADNH